MEILKNVSDQLDFADRVPSILKQFVLLFTNRVTWSTSENTKPDLFIQLELLKSMCKSEGFVFQSMDRVNQSVNKLLYHILIF